MGTCCNGVGVAEMGKLRKTKIVAGSSTKPQKKTSLTFGQVQNSHNTCVRIIRVKYSQGSEELKTEFEMTFLACFCLCSLRWCFLAIHTLFV